MIANVSKHLYLIIPGENGNNEIMIGVCPNPSDDHLNLLIMNKFEVMVYELSNDKNLVLQVKAFTGNEECINLEKHNDPNFILRVYDERRLLKSFQIQKIFSTNRH